MLDTKLVKIPSLTSTHYIMFYTQVMVTHNKLSFISAANYFLQLFYDLDRTCEKACQYLGLNDSRSSSSPKDEGACNSATHSVNGIIQTWRTFCKIVYSLYSKNYDV